MLYPKIPGPFNRHIDGPNRNKLDFFNWTSPELEMLSGLTWNWTEKVDGTNVRIIWDGYKVTFGGRSDNAAIPATLVTVLRELFPEEIMEQVFGKNPVTLFGEGYGAGIQSGGKYRKDAGFVLFDVLVDQWWLKRDSLKDIATKLGIDLVPYVLRGSVLDAIRPVSQGMYSKWAGGTSFHAEGLVGTIDLGLLTRGGERIQVKIKHKDFHGVDIDREWWKLAGE